MIEIAKNAATAATPVAGVSGFKPTVSPTEDFAATLAGLMGQTIDTIRQGEAAAIGGLSGGMPVQEVVNKVMAAEQSLQAGIALRDKIVAAYLEISRMSI